MAAMAPIGRHIEQAGRDQRVGNGASFSSAMSVASTLALRHKASAVARRSPDPPRSQCRFPASRPAIPLAFIAAQNANCHAERMAVNPLAPRPA